MTWDSGAMINFIYVACAYNHDDGEWCTPGGSWEEAIEFDKHTADKVAQEVVDIAALKSIFGAHEYDPMFFRINCKTSKVVPLKVPLPR